MRIRGYFGSFDAAYVKAKIICEQLNIRRSVKFLLDIGAAVTVISDKDVIRLKVDYNKLEKPKKGISGIGGKVETYLMDDVKILFESDQGEHVESMDRIFVTRHKPRNNEEREIVKLIPSLLGRDILNKYGTVVDKRTGKVVITDEKV